MELFPPPLEGETGRALGVPGPAGLFHRPKGVHSMYSVVVLMALSTSADAPDFGRHGGRGGCCGGGYYSGCGGGGYYSGCGGGYYSGYSGWSSGCSGWGSAYSGGCSG